MKTSLKGDRRAWIVGVGAAMLSNWDARTGLSDDDSVTAAASVASDVDVAVSRGVDFLLKAQRPDGAIADRGYVIAITSLAITAMAAAGNRPDRTQRGMAMRKAIDFVLKEGHQDERGYFGKPDSSRMYGHGITTWMLSEILSLEVEPQHKNRLRDALIPAAYLILAAQNVAKPEKEFGGWHYTPTLETSDLSVSTWQLMALRSAKNNEVDVSEQAFEKSLGYLRILYMDVTPSDFQRDEIGKFRYRPDSPPTFSMTACGLSATQLCGQSNSPMAKGAANWLLEYQPEKSERFLYYGLFHYAHGMNVAGEAYSQKATKVVSKLLLELQQSDGAFLAGGGEEQNYGMVYCTALAILGLTAGAGQSN